MGSPTLDLGRAIFAGLNVFMLICAGVAAMAPARDKRVFIGALIMFCAWAFVVAAINLTGNRKITSSLWVLDIFYAIGFYWLSRPLTQLHPNEPAKISWASYTVAVFAPMVFLEICRHLYLYDRWYTAPAAGLLVVVLVALLIGFMRGYGWKRALIYLTAVGALILASFISYNTTLNFLTYCVIAIITSAAWPSCRVNLMAWWRRFDRQDQV